MLPLKYRVLEILSDAYQKSGESPVQNAESIIGAALPEIDGATLLSILADLRSEK